MNPLELLQTLEDVMHILEIAGTNGHIAAILTCSKAIEKAQREMDAQAPKIAGLSKEAALAYFHPRLFRSLPTWSTMPRIGEKCTLPTPPLASPSEQEEIQLSAAQMDEMREDDRLARDLNLGANI